MKNLFKQALIKYIAGLVLVGLLVFLPAGTFEYAGGWLFMGLLFVPMLVLGIVLLIKAPELLEKRLNNWGWTDVPNAIVIIASVLLLVGYGLYMEVMRENAYLSRTVEVQEGQEVIDTGLYGLVRHPMYFATVLMFLAIPLVLGSWIGFVVFLVHPFLMVKRIRNEETVLEDGLAGYIEYKEKVKYRMIPFVW